MKNTIQLIFTVIILVLNNITIQAQTINSNWESDLTKALAEFQRCQGDQCAGIHGQNLKRVYKINDFYNAKQQRYMTVNEINDYLKSSSKWQKLGPAYDDKTLAQAQEMANDKKAVVAMYMDEQGLGHLALIVPGSLTLSGSWGRKVPNSTSFPINDLSKSFVSKSLSYAFRRSQLKELTIYGRKY